MSHITEKDWITASGLRAVVVICLRENGTKSHRCGYVEVPKGNPLHGVKYNQPHASLKKFARGDFEIGKRGAILALTAGVHAEEGDVVRCSPDVAFNVHGGLTYSGGVGYPAPGDGWWFGFDCAHCDDGFIDPDEHHQHFNGPERTLRYCVSECEDLATQIKQAVTV